MRARQLLSSALLAALALVACEDDGATPVSPERSDPGPAVLPEAPRMNPLSTGIEGYPTVGEQRTGFIVGPNGRPLEVHYELHDGFAVWQGDMIIGREGEIARSIAELDLTRPGPLRGVVIGADGGNNRWPGGVIPYTINAANPPTQSIVDDAIDWIEDQTPGVTLVPRTGEADYVTFQNASGCSSEIGRVGGQQFINLKVNDGISLCTVGNAAHEILHALGMYHEHTRCDRDDFVSIDYDEIEENREGNFYKAGSGSEDGDCSGAFDVGAYDFGSIMHYPVDAFAVGSNPTIIPTVTVPPGVTIGQRNGLSDTDAATIDQLYGVNNASPVPEVAITGARLEGSVLSFDGTGSSDADDDQDLLGFSWIFGDGTCPGAAACSDDNPTHVYAQDGTFGWSLSVTDGFDTGAMGATLDILNVVPSVSAGPDVTLDEGDVFSRNGSFTDPGADPWNATIDYGDGGGANPLGLSNKTFVLSHTYVDDVGSPFTLTVAVTDDDATGTDDVSISVTNVAPTVDAGSDAEVESGGTFQFSGSFSDPGVVDNPWSWSIDWGNGSDVSGSTDDQAAMIEDDLGVCGAGIYTVTLTVTDKDGGVDSDDLELTVAYVAVQIDILPGSDANPINRRGGGSLPVAILGSVEFDVSDLDLSTLVLGDEVGSETAIGQKNNGTYEAYVEDVNADGIEDLVVMFPNRSLVQNDVTETTTELVLRGVQADGCTNVRGVGTVSVLGD